MFYFSSFLSFDLFLVVLTIFNFPLPNIHTFFDPETSLCHINFSQCFSRSILSHLYCIDAILQYSHNDGLTTQLYMDELLSYVGREQRLSRRAHGPFADPIIYPQRASH